MVYQSTALNFSGIEWSRGLRNGFLHLTCSYTQVFNSHASKISSEYSLSIGQASLIFMITHRNMFHAYTIQSFSQRTKPHFVNSPRHLGIPKTVHTSSLPPHPHPTPNHPMVIPASTKASMDSIHPLPPPPSYRAPIGVFSITLPLGVCFALELLFLSQRVVVMILFFVRLLWSCVGWGWVSHLGL